MAYLLTLLYVGLIFLSASVFSPDVASLHIMEFLVVIATLASLGNFVSSGILSLPEAPFYIGLFASIIISTAAAWLGQLPTTILFMGPVVFGFLFIATVCRSLTRIRTLATVLHGVAFFALAQAALAYSQGSTLSRYLFVEGKGPGALIRFRGLGVLADPNDFAQFLVTLAPLLFLRWRKDHGFANFFLCIVPACLFAVGIFYTHSRGGAIALVAVVLFGLKDKLGLLRSIVLAAVSAAGLLALNVGGGRGINQDDGDRFGLWYTGLQVFKTHPLFGVGINNFIDYSNTGQTAHNSFVLCLAELGLVGYFFWMGSLVSTITSLSGIIVRKPKDEAEQDAGDLLPTGPRGGFISPPSLSASVASRSSRQLTFAPATASPSGFGSPLPAYGSSSRALDRDGGVQTFEGDLSEDPPDADEFSQTAKGLRLAFVGFLVSAFFISRTYTMALFMLLGMSVALKLTYREAFPEAMTDNPPLLRRILIIIFCSVLFLYLFVRLHYTS